MTFPVSIPDAKLTNSEAVAVCPPLIYSVFNDDATCEDIDNGAVDSIGDPCSMYHVNPSWCGGYDDDDFISSSLCCACNGGEIVNTVPNAAIFTQSSPTQMNEFSIETSDMLLAATYNLVIRV